MRNQQDPPAFGRLTRLLCRWGEWHERYRLFSGYPSRSTLHYLAMTGLAGDMRPGHKILEPEMSLPLRRIQRAWMALSSDDHRQMIYCKYALDRDSDGRLITDADRAGILHCSMLDFHSRFLAARRDLRRCLKAFSLEAASGS